MRRGGLVRAWLLVLVAAAAALMPHGARAQVNFDRPGADYLRAPVSSNDPADCALMCERDRRCRSWTFSYPQAPEDGAFCWLKSGVPQRSASNCCVSGVRGAGVIEPRNGSVEASIDRFGGDYRNFEMKSGEADDACKAACEEDNKCRAWTFARAGLIGRNARCFLKNQIKPPRRKPGFVSGVVR
ncbi:PAN domain-containing protein [Rhodopseudomonas sp. HC1]|uniref:PAN domain-containing protein n=1 Tax=Rhodopseudomonas infernalis TaxID=2897386 RepID=UPI001EE8A1D4|nr:PAN domain-containing protein [Rhodopseudomonas infernalis]MCG6207504.1 PAN domain-containing protein [Rhodopseudomonas infernalis]